MRNEKCCTSEQESPLVADPTSVPPRSMESLREKIEWMLTPCLVIFSPTPDGSRKSKTLIVSRVQNTPSFPSASDELTLHMNKEKAAAVRNDQKQEKNKIYICHIIMFLLFKVSTLNLASLHSVSTSIVYPIV